jgi:hypothetical protein
MDRTPHPKLEDFRGKLDAEILFEAAMKRWDEKLSASIVKNKDEEEKWLAEHADDPVLTPGVYPKTMDKTHAPAIASCNGLEDYRQKRQEWRERVQASIVYDEVEEQLWLEEHAVPPAPAAPAPVKKARKAKAVAA